MLMQGQQLDYGVNAPEALLPAEDFFEALAQREIIVHETVQESEK
jgi:hypothetical protein